jgi:glycosyltransferase involved in cell wall biosynthesis
VETRPYPFARTQGLARLYFDQVVLPLQVQREGGDVLFSATGFGTLYSPVPQVLLVRNMKYFDPQYYETRKSLGRSMRRTRLRRWHSLLSIWAADAVLFPTRAMQAAVEAHISLPPATTHAVHYGFAADRAAAGEGPEGLLPEGLLPEDDGPVLLNVSTYAIHKNLETLVEALPRLRAQHPRLTLVTTTSRTQTADTAEYDALKARAEALGVEDAWTELGYVPHGQLFRLYRAADAYVFPSFTESFGHSMVEAMAAGLPVVAADTAVNREVCAAAGTYFSPFCPADCARAVHAVLSAPCRRAHMREASLQRADAFSWTTHAERLAALFANVTGRT